MLVSSIKDKLPEKFFKTIEFEEFRPSQSKAIDRGLLESKNMLICSPTASGKTFVAELAGIKSIIETGGKMIYIVPLKSLATEKAEEFKKYEEIGIKTAVSIGDPESKDPWLANADIIVCTSEKFDSLLRHNISWLNKIKVAVFDEIHLINDSNRGPTLEVIITLLKTLLNKIQIIGLSATIGNPKELSDWLEGELIQDSWRPVKLIQGIYADEEINFEKKVIPVEKIKNDATLSLALDTINLGKQALIFCPTKKSAQSTAKKISNLIKSELNKDLSSKIKSAAGVPTMQCEELGDCVSKGIAFHHSGLLSKQKKIVEENFKNNIIKIICCTPTLAMGVNLPAFRVIMKSLKRYGK
ncbi:MAG: DEAD/DEAH box helicase, partial [Candidatus Woesearchaeota archaeon]